MRYLDRALTGLGGLALGAVAFLGLPTWVGVAGFVMIAAAVFLPDRFRR